jgi:RNA polymerase sigma-70 factor (ECF subfamily)
MKGMSRLVRGAQAVVSRLPDGRVFSVIAFTIAGGRVVEMDILADPDRLSRLDLSASEP